jgi:hypothetical protein
MKNLDIEPCGGDGYAGGSFHEALLLVALHNVLDDTVGHERARQAFLNQAPPEDQGLFEEVVESLAAGHIPDQYALAALFRYVDIFSGLTFRRGGRVEDDTGFAGEEPWL